MGSFNCIQPLTFLAWYNKKNDKTIDCLFDFTYVNTQLVERVYNGGVIVSVLESSVVNRRFEPRSGQTKDYKIGICCFFTKHATLRRKSKDWLARNQNNVSEWTDMSICGLLFQ